MKNALFIHVPKTAGMTAARALGLKVFKRGIADSIRPEAIKKEFDGTGMVTFRHALYRNLRKAGVFSEEFERTSFKFCFCRNPYDRAVSHWKFTMRKHPDRLEPGTSFRDFTRLLGTKRDWIPQFTWVHGVNLDFIGRFETLEEDIRTVGAELGIEVGDIPKLNATRHDHYTTYYCAEAKANIDNYYTTDFRFFGYGKEL